MQLKFFIYLIKCLTFFSEESRDMNGHPEDDLKRQRTQYTADPLYTNVRNQTVKMQPTVSASSNSPSFYCQPLKPQLAANNNYCIDRNNTYINKLDIPSDYYSTSAPLYNNYYDPSISHYPFQSYFGTCHNNYCTNNDFANVNQTC